MSSSKLPAVSLAAVPGRRLATLELAAEIERRDFAGIYCPSVGDGLALCQSLSHSTRRIALGTAISNIYTRQVSEYAHTASFIHEVSGGRFHFGVGVSHTPLLEPLGIRAGRPLADMRKWVADYRNVPRAGESPPLVLATMRMRMVALAGEIAEGVVFANAARSHMPASLAALSQRATSDSNFFIGAMLATCISNDLEAAKAVNRRTMAFYLTLPNYRNYWKEAGWVEEMEAVEKVLQSRDPKALPGVISDRWLADVTLSGSPSEIRDGVESWREAGVRTPILVPSSAAGNQMRAFEELFECFS